MMLGIFLTIIAMIFTVYIPLWAKTGEANHMEEVENSFLDFKSTIDKQITDNEGIGTTYTTSVRLGAEGGAVLGIGQTTGNLDFETDEFSFTIVNSDDNFNSYGNSFGNVKFTSENIYYTDQFFTYENGAVIVEQNRRSAMRAEPHFNIEYDVITNKTSIDTTMIQLSGNPDGVSGTDHHTISSKLIQSVGKSNILSWTEEKGFPNGQNLTLNMTTKFGPLWEQFFNKQLDKLPSDIRNTTTISMTSVTDPYTEISTYNLVIRIDNVHILNCKKGIAEIRIN
jgi:hypothetical protein